MRPALTPLTLTLVLSACSAALKTSSTAGDDGSLSGVAPAVTDRGPATFELGPSGADAGGVSADVGLRTGDAEAAVDARSPDAASQADAAARTDATPDPPLPEPDAAEPLPPPPDAPCAPRPYARPEGCPFEVEVVIWTVGGWNLLADAFAANPAPCAHYYISVPPLAGDKTTLRDGEAARVRAHGPQFHALAEFQDGAWGEWREAAGATWAAAGGEFRRRALDAGYCFGQGDGWIVNEVHSDARVDPASRDRWVNLVRALHDGAEGGADDAPGAVAVIGMGHNTENMAVYKPNLRGWLADRGFWEGVAPYVRWWAQESYCDTGLVCVAGDLDARIQHINRYAMHVGRLAVLAPDEANVNTAQSYFSRAFVPMLNAVWGSTRQNGYGDTDVDLETMKMFITEQVYANRRYADGNAHPGGRISFAFKSYRTPSEYAALGERMAQAIAAAYAPGAEALAACQGNGGAAGWCRCRVAGAAFNDAWDAFQSW